MDTPAELAAQTPHRTPPARAADVEAREVLRAARASNADRPDRIVPLAIVDGPDGRPVYATAHLYDLRVRLARSAGVVVAELVVDAEGGLEPSDSDAVDWLAALPDPAALRARLARKLAALVAAGGRR